MSNTETNATRKVEVITSVQRRRRFSASEKMCIVNEIREVGVSVLFPGGHLQVYAQTKFEASWRRVGIKLIFDCYGGMHCNINSSNYSTENSCLSVDGKNRRRAKAIEYHDEAADKQACAGHWLHDTLFEISRFLPAVLDPRLSSQKEAIRRAVDTQCTVSLQVALSDLTSEIIHDPAPIVQPRMMDKALRMQVVVAIGQVAAANNVGMLQTFVHYGFASRIWMGPFGMDCAASYGCLTAMAFMITHAAASYQDAQEALYARRQPKSKSLYECTYELDITIARNVDPRLFSLE